MSNDLNTTSNVHIYKPKRGTLALNIFSLFFYMIIMGIPLIAFILIILSFFQAKKGFDIFAIFFGCIIIPIIVLLIFNLLQITISTVLSFFSYVKISPDGVEQKRSPYKHIRSNWSDVDKLGKFFFFNDVLYLNTYEILGFSLSLKSPFRLFRPKQGFINLTGYEGWPNGQLASNLKQYIPTLFENQATLQEIPPEKKEAEKEVQATEMSILSQETRLLAAISHMSVLIPNLGFFITIGIYFTQKNKSSYLGFQSLQALIWQFVMFLFSMLTSACMVGSILIPVLFTTASQNETVIALSSGSVLIAIAASVFLMTIGNLGFIIYGIVGAIMTYQGKDFRYIFIGNRIKKGKGVTSTNGT